MKDIEKKIKLLTEQSNKFLNEPFNTLDDLKNIKLNGVYIVYKDREPIYVGSSTKEGHRRVRDLVLHWSNHTLHRKLLIEKLNEKFNLNLTKLVWCKKGRTSKHSKEQLIKDRKITEQQFEEADKEIKRNIMDFNFRFIDLSSKNKKEIKNFEHFIISVLDTFYND